jgi:hypothetical protein
MSYAACRLEDVVVKGDFPKDGLRDLEPELFSAYQGTSQLVEYHANQNATYQRTLELTRAAGDKEAVASLEALGAPPWENPRGRPAGLCLAREFLAVDA